jgi:hypothetical protein
MSTTTSFHETLGTPSFHQTLVDQAYDIWKVNPGWSYDHFISTLEDPHHSAVLLGNMNYQVSNGGWRQWHDNGYSSQAEALTRVLESIVEVCPLASEIIRMVECSENCAAVGENLSQLDFLQYEGEAEYLDREAYEGAFEEAFEPTEEMDKTYYRIDHDFMTQVEVWLRQREGEEIPEAVKDSYNQSLMWTPT